MYYYNSRKQFPFGALNMSISVSVLHIFIVDVYKGKKKLRKIEEWLEVWYGGLFSQSNVFIANWKVTEISFCP